MPELSVIIPVYNTAAYLRRCLDSVINQTMRDIEIILASDGPEDCDAICREYAAGDSRIKLIERPGSYGAAVNRGIEQAQSDFIGIVEADDWIAPHMYEKLYQTASETRADVVKASFYFSYDNDINTKAPDFQNPHKICSIRDYPAFLSYQASIWSAIYNKSFLQKQNIVLPEQRLSFVDSPFHMETFLKAARYAFINEPLYYYYQDNPGQSVKDDRHITDIIATNDFFLSRLDKTSRENYKPWIIQAVIDHLFWNFKRLSQNKAKNAFLQAASQYIRKLNLKEKDLTRLDSYQLIFLHGLRQNLSAKQISQKLIEKVRWIKLCGILPLVKIKEQSLSSRALLGGILPLYKITRKQHKTIIKLFNFIPICKKG